MKTLQRYIIALATTLVALTQAPAQAQNVQYEVDFATEMQTDFHNANWANLLRLSLDWQLPRGFVVRAGTISVAMTRSESLVGDLQTYSNLNEENLALAISHLGVGWTGNNDRTSVFVGITNVNENFFTSPCTSLFTNASCGIFPTLSANHDIANYPVASLGVDFQQQWRNFTLQTALFGGHAHNRFTGHHNVFCLHPDNDGIFSITSLAYEHNDAHYSIGCAIHSGMRSAEGLGIEETATKTREKANFAPWVNIEQPLGSRFHLLAQASITSRKDVDCRHYKAIGLLGHFGIADCGVILNHANFAEACETALELTSKIQLFSNAYMQPTWHIIRTGNNTSHVAMLRFGITIGN